MMGYKSDLIYKKVKSIRNKIIKTSRPYFIEFLTYRLYEHCGVNNDDDLKYRPIQEIKFWKNNCPLFYLKNKFKNMNKEFIKIEKTIDLKILKSFIKAKKSKFPNKKLLSMNIYA